MTTQTQPMPSLPAAAAGPRVSGPTVPADLRLTLVRTAAIVLVLVLQVAIVVLATGIGAAPGPDAPGPQPGRMAAPTTADVAR